MKQTQTNNTDRLSDFKALYDAARAAMAEKLDEFEKYERQYRASCELDGSGVNASTVRNITYEIIESEVNSDIPTPKADSISYTEQRERNARSIERLCSAVKDRLPFEAMNDLDERYTYIYGGSVWYIEWDSSDRNGCDVGGVRVHCISPLDFIPQPGVCSVDDMDYCFLRFTTTRNELTRKYGIPEDMLSLAECDYQYDTDTRENDTATVIVTFWRDENGDIGKLVFSGDLLLSDIPCYYSRKIDVCSECGLEDSACTCGGKRVKENLCDEHVARELLPLGAECDAYVKYYTPKVFPIVIRKNSSSTPSLYGTSDCETLRYHQQAINKVESRILQKLLRAGITPVMPEDSSVTLNNAVFGQVIKMKAGESLAQYGKIDTTPDIDQDIKEADRLYDQAKRIMGISDALVGSDSISSESGYSRQLKILQANGRLQSKRQLKYHAYSEIYRRIFEHFLAFADEPRPLSYKDGFGRVHTSEFSKYDFLEPICDGEYAYYDGYLFSVDLNGGAGYLREELWERNLTNLKAGTIGDPTSPVTLLRYWQSQERAHYPYARENVEYFKSIVEQEENKESENKNEV
ncbi:MAG: hypothetical protein IJW03_02725 [Clostridia bacterium]|nr:hypothetical protein [Clostridia bacterium]